ncbi:suppressor of fused domain protein [Micromonospora sp. C31]|uniref:suppressor of fused domain protein n=1 Tax=Micromonospora sp. C31 TaxID=2824876 RepID=UPI001B36E9D2|nr:suppressor of fused domain protein [Micromonospora sp. C31]MBQ1071926.1 suppressor of fused domain protein [Micromonospora sp. C31]
MASSDAPRGSGILRHEARERGWEPAAVGDPDTHEAIERHIEHHFGPVDHVLHEIASELVHLDVHLVRPTEERPWLTLVTSGMSDLPMTVPAGADVSPYAELTMSLPADWPLGSAPLGDDSTYWPVRLLKAVARLPHEYDTWLGEWHSVPNGDPAQPYAPDVPFAGVVVTQMLHCRSSARTIVTDGGKKISLLALVPLHPAEVTLKLTRGTDALIEALDRAGVSERLDPARPSTV